MSDEASRIVDEPSPGPQETSPADGAVAQPLPDAPEVQIGQSATEEVAVESVSPETDSAAAPPMESPDSQQSDSEEGQSDAAEPDEEKVEKPTSFTPMSVDSPSEAKKAKQASDESIEMDWYILKVQSNRERSIADALRRKVAIEGLDPFFGDVVVPTEKVTEFKGGKKKVVERKLYPGYIVVHMHINDDTWFAVRETSGIGDFTGSGGKPTPMLAHEVARIVQTEEEETSESPKLNINFQLGNQVKIKDGTFESFEGEVSTIDEQSGRITVMINIFGRSTPVELEYWQVEPM